MARNRTEPPPAEDTPPGPSGFFALSTIVHDGVQYVAGDELPLMEPAQLEALQAAGCVSQVTPDEDHHAPDGDCTPA